MVWVGFKQEDPDRTVLPVASAGFEQGYLETLHLTWADRERGRGATGTAIRTGKPCMGRDTWTDPAFEPWRAEAKVRGYRSSLALPLSEGHRTFGAVTIYSREVDAFSEEEVALLGELASDLVLGIRTRRLRAAKAEAERTNSGLTGRALS